MDQLLLFPKDEPPVFDDPSKSPSDSTFIDNMQRPVHRWFRYSAGYSGEWVESLLRARRHLGGTVLLDPFCGSGTTLLAADSAGEPSIGVEAHPFVFRVAKAKLAWHSDPLRLEKHASALLDGAERGEARLEVYPSLIRTCYPDRVLSTLDVLRRSWLQMDDGGPESQLTWLALTSILRSCSPVGTANMELIQPRKTKKTIVEPLAAFRNAVRQFVGDMRAMQAIASPRSILLSGDARVLNGIEDHSVDLVITSPPYVNNFDYADAVRLEMSFWGDVASWKDLHETVRRHLVVSCAQHATAEKIEPEKLLLRPEVEPIRDELTRVFLDLSKVRLEKGGRKHYHSMVVGYFVDLAQVLRALKRVCRPGAVVCLVIGDSAPYGVYVPVHEWLGSLARFVGFEVRDFEKLRDRNLKWKNRKHRVPLLEGRLWLTA